MKFKDKIGVVLFIMMFAGAICSFASSQQSQTTTTFLSATPQNVGTMRGEVLSTATELVPFPTMTPINPTASQLSFSIPDRAPPLCYGLLVIAGIVVIVGFIRRK